MELNQPFTSDKDSDLSGRLGRSEAVAKLYDAFHASTGDALAITSKRRIPLISDDWHEAEYYSSKESSDIGDDRQCLNR